MMHPSLLTILVFALFAPGSEGWLCPSVSLPQDVPWYCKGGRDIALKHKRLEYGIREPTESMPFARLENGLLHLTYLLVREPFLKTHADKWRLLAIHSEATKAAYSLAKHVHGAPNIMNMDEFSSMPEFFRSQPRVFLDGYVKMPSDIEPFQNQKAQWISDDWFADQRLAGTNPMSLKRITFSDEIGYNWNQLRPKLNGNFEWDEVVSKTLNGMPLKTAIEEGYLFVLYHPLSDDLRTMNDNGDKDPERKMWNFMSPIAIFASAKGKLVPVAIQMDHTPESQVYTPKDGDLWTLAKLNVQLTDFETSQIVEHLCKVHLVSEGLCIVIDRQLSRKHPLSLIMRYHCRGVLTANTYGGPVLLSKNNKLDNLFPYGYVGSNALVVKAAKMIEWGDIKLENNIKRRGVDNRRILPYYPFRDDGAEIDKVIKLMVRDYVHAYYGSDSEVRRDNELQNYAREVSDKGRDSKVKLRGFPASINTKNELVETFSRIIWLMTGHHASVNYPMVDYVTYVPNTPLKLYDSGRVTKTKYSPERLPNRHESASQASFAVTLASYRQDRLFDYSPDIKDSKGKYVVAKYHSHLNEKVAPLLEARNKNRLAQGHLTYPYMQPKWIPNGIQT